MQMKPKHYIHPPLLSNFSLVAANSSCWIGDTNRSIGFLSFWGATFGLISHSHPSNRANSCCCSSKHDVPPSLLVIVITHLHFFSINCSGSIGYHHEAPPGSHGRPVGDG
uniref:Uncharacterized protein n=1 Tax=Lotus japonicus TaxID=34305 RepID=I3T9E0_LOTJA|nr:unknown [Lotus japonicus]